MIFLKIFCFGVYLVVMGVFYIVCGLDIKVDWSKYLIDRYIDRMI